MATTTTQMPAEELLAAVPHDHRTTAGLPLPHFENSARLDIERIRAALLLVDRVVASVPDTVRDFLDSDAAKRALELAQPPRLVSVAYDGDGNPTRIEETIGELTRITEPTYGDAGRVERVRITIGAFVRTDTYQYDGSGRVSGSTVAITETV